jgi:hypothetical protein
LKKEALDPTLLAYVVGRSNYLSATTLKTMQDKENFSFGR